MLLTKIIKFLETPGFVYFSMGLKVEYLGFAPSVSSGGLEGSLSSQQVGYMPQILTHWPEITDDGCTRVLHSPTWFGSYVNFDLIASILYPFYSVFSLTSPICPHPACLHPKAFVLSVPSACIIVPPGLLADSSSFWSAQKLLLPRSLSSSFIEHLKYKKEYKIYAYSPVQRESLETF